MSNQENNKRLPNPMDLFLMMMMEEAMVLRVLGKPMDATNARERKLAMNLTDDDAKILKSMGIKV